MAQAYFLVMALGVPLLLLILAIVAGASYRGSYATLLDWRPTRSPQREAELQHDDVDQMLAALNRYRRRRGAPERSLEEAARASWASTLGMDTFARTDDG
jgi:hypothetical protein